MDHSARQYYNPGLAADEERTLLRRNYLLLQTGQATLGLIGPDMLAIAIEAQPEAVVLYFAVAARTAELEQDIEDIVAELEACLSGGPEQHAAITIQIHVGQPDSTWPGHAHTLSYREKPRD